MARTSTATTPLHVAIESRGKSVVEFLIEAGCDLERLDSQGQSPLDLAVRQTGFKRVVARLEKAGARTALEISRGGRQGGAGGTPRRRYCRAATPGRTDYASCWGKEDVAQAEGWHALIEHCLGSNASKPSKRWKEVTDTLIDGIGETAYRDALHEWLPMVGEKRAGLTAMEDLFDEHCVPPAQGTPVECGALR